MPLKKCANGHEYEIGKRRLRGCPRCRVEATARWRDRNPQKVRLAAQVRALRKRGLDWSDRARLVDGICDICGEMPPERRGERRLHVDHNHVTGEIRGVLCQRCNMGLGQFRDSTELMRRAIEYLEVWDATAKRLIA